MIIRLARREDIPYILQIVRLCIPEKILDLTIFSCEGVEKYIEDIITTHNLKTKNLIIVAEVNNKVIGMAEFIRNGDYIFLNHIYVTSSMRGMNVGSRLFMEGLLMARNMGQKNIFLDVFKDNIRALSWYHSLGFEIVQEMSWVIFNYIGNGKPLNNGGYILKEYSKALRLYSIYGFSEFILQTRKGEYRIGLLGEKYYRITEKNLLFDCEALNVLNVIDPNRKFLGIFPYKLDGENIYEVSYVVCDSYKMKNDIDFVIEKLRAKL